LSETDQDTQPTDRGSGGGVQRPPRVLISYRRADTRGYAGWIYQWLCERFGKASVFKDIDTIKLGQDWRKVIQSEVAQCDALIALIGPRWLDATDDHGRRLHDEGDVLRAEIEHALNRDIPVVPVLVDDAVMPRAQDLPASLRSLPDRQALRLTELHFEQDMDALADDLQQAVIERAQQEAGRASAAIEERVVVLPPSPPIEPNHAPAAPAGPTLPSTLEEPQRPPPPPGPLQPGTAAPGGPSSRRGLVIVAMAVAALGVAIALVLVTRGGPERAEQVPNASSSVSGGSPTQSPSAPESPTQSPSAPPVTHVDAFASSLPIEIEARGSANPYPSEIDVSGLAGRIVDVSVMLHGLSHSFPDDVDVLLVGPDGQAVVLMSDVGGSDEVADLMITFADSASRSMPDGGTIESGLYRPSDGTGAGGFQGHDPAPGPPYESHLSALAGADPNGTWRLFVHDDAALDFGQISGGWSVEITTSS
jgi:hypothetical protein